MTFTDPAQKHPRSLIFNNKIKPSDNKIRLSVHGQGVFLFSHVDTSKPCTFNFCNGSGSEEVLSVEFAENSVIAK
jgi:hypothetical protein